MDRTRKEFFFFSCFVYIYIFFFVKLGGTVQPPPHFLKSPHPAPRGKSAGFTRPGEGEKGGGIHVSFFFCEGEISDFCV